jgi:hypothetical protein
MYLNRFSLQVEKGRETDNGYVELRHNTEYALRLRNDRDVAADAVVRIDGLEVGTWRIPAHQNILIERPASIDRKLTFYKLGTSEANQAGLERNSDLGLVSVDFIPAKEVFRPFAPQEGIKSVSRPFQNPYGETGTFGGGSKGVTTKGFSAGGTGLGDRSNQQFGEAQPIDRDYSQQVTINLRLVAVNEPAIVSLRSAVSSPVPPSVY